MSKSWKSDDLIKEYGSLILEWSEEGLGRVRCVRQIESLTGKTCSPGVMQTVLKKVRQKKKVKRIPIEQPKQNDDDCLIEDLINMN